MGLCSVCRDAVQNFHSPTRRVYSSWYWLLWLGGKYDDSAVIQPKTQAASAPFLQRLRALFDSRTPSHLIGHHPSFESYQQSCRDGCVVCLVLQGVSQDDVNPTIASQGYFSLCALTKAGTDEPRFLIYYGYDMEGPPLTLQKGGDGLLNTNISPSTEDQQAWAMVQTWLESCLNSHRICDASVDTSFIPSRLLQAKGSSPQSMMFRLVTRQQVQPDTRYVTLSYCWGGPPSDLNFILTKANFEALSSWQPVSTLPRTFRDAFTITHRLGISLLWIDRFCILQDSVEDWKAEAASMRDVYSNTFLTIAALSAGNDDGGCFFSRDPADVSPNIVSVRRRASDKNPSPYVLELDITDSWRHHLEREILLERGWVVQERVLSPRIVYFGQRQIFWECREANCCETHPATIFINIATGDNGQTVFEKEPARGKHCRWKQLSDSYVAEPNPDPIQQALSEWRRIASHYAACRLTVASDKLVALSAVAQDMQLLLLEQGLDSRYYAGIWAFEMPTGLLWQTVEGASAARPPTSEYRAPSWSWASLDIGVLLVGIGVSPVRGGGLTPVVTVVNVAMTLVDEGNEVGQVAGGYVRMKGKLFWATLDVSTEEYMEPSLRWNYVKTLGHPSRGSSGSSGGGGQIVRLTDESRWNIASFDVIEDIHDEFLVLPVCLEWRENPAEKCWVVKSLALEWVGGDQYRRLGYVELHLENSEVLDRVLGAVEDREFELI